MCYSPASYDISRQRTEKKKKKHQETGRGENRYQEVVSGVSNRTRLRGTPAQGN